MQAESYDLPVGINSPIRFLGVRARLGGAARPHGGIDSWPVRGEGENQRSSSSHTHTSIHGSSGNSPFCGHPLPPRSDDFISGKKKKEIETKRYDLPNGQHSSRDREVWFILDERTDARKPRTKTSKIIHDQQPI